MWEKLQKSVWDGSENVLLVLCRLGAKALVIQ